VDKVVAMLHCHASQFYEWLPYNTGTENQVPRSQEDKQAWLATQVYGRLARQANRFRDRLIRDYGKERGESACYAEAFEPCEYGAPFDDAARRRLFPFVPVGHP
jgi:hypothetical protein